MVEALDAFCEPLLEAAVDTLPENANHSHVDFLLTEYTTLCFLAVDEFCEFWSKAVTLPKGTAEWPVKFQRAEERSFSEDATLTLGFISEPLSEPATLLQGAVESPASLTLLEGQPLFSDAVLRLGVFCEERVLNPLTREIRPGGGARSPDILLQNEW